MANMVNQINAEDPFLKVPLVQAARECDGMIMKSRGWLSEYTILFASHFMSNPIVYQADKIVAQGKFTGASNGMSAVRELLYSVALFCIFNVVSLFRSTCNNRLKIDRKRSELRLAQ